MYYRYVVRGAVTKQGSPHFVLTLVVDSTRLCSQHCFNRKSVDETRQPVAPDCKKLSDECSTGRTNEPRSVVEPRASFEIGRVIAAGGGVFPSCS